MSSKRQTTMAKMLREQAVRERRARKQLKRAARKAEKLRTSGGAVDAPEHATGETPPESALEAEEVVEQPEEPQGAGTRESDGVGWPLRAPGQES